MSYTFRAAGNAIIGHRLLPTFDPFLTFMALK